MKIYANSNLLENKKTIYVEASNLSVEGFKVIIGEHFVAKTVQIFEEPPKEQQAVLPIQSYYSLQPQKSKDSLLLYRGKGMIVVPGERPVIFIEIDLPRWWDKRNDLQRSEDITFGCYKLYDKEGNVIKTVGHRPEGGK